MDAHIADYLTAALDENGADYARSDRFSIPEGDRRGLITAAVHVGNLGDFIAAVATAAADIATNESPNSSVEDFTLNLRELRTFEEPHELTFY